MPSKWEQILEQKPIPLQEHLLDEASKLFAAELQRWPPAIEEIDLSTGRQLAILLADEPAAPDHTLMREAFALARFDLGRDLDAYDDYMRNQRWLEKGLAAGDKPMLLFVSRFIEEQLLSLGEATQGRVNRNAMLDVLDRTERRVLKEA